MRGMSHWEWSGRDRVSNPAGPYHMEHEMFNFLSIENSYYSPVVCMRTVVNNQHKAMNFTCTAFHFVEHKVAALSESIVPGIALFASKT